MNPGFWTNLTEGITSVQQRNVLQPLIYLLGVVGTFGLFLVKLLPQFALASFILFVVCLLFALVFYCYFAFTTPDRLQTETFQLKKMQYETAIESKHGVYTSAAQVESRSVPSLPPVGDTPKESAT
jgi:phosphotransferase system  glucose/maltose/N-acetylglucosamine-specific IIC component